MFLLCLSRVLFLVLFVTSPSVSFSFKSLLVMSLISVCVSLRHVLALLFQSSSLLSHSCTRSCSCSCTSFFVSVSSQVLSFSSKLLDFSASFSLSLSCIFLLPLLPSSIVSLILLRFFSISPASSIFFTVLVFFTSSSSLLSERREGKWMMGRMRWEKMGRWVSFQFLKRRDNKIQIRDRIERREE